MEARLQRRVQRYGWDRAAAHYDDGWRQALAPATEALLGLAALQPGERVLDVACGTGVLAMSAARAVGPGGLVIGLDISERMIQAASDTALALGFRHCTFRRCGAEEIGAEVGSFGAALCGLGLMYVPEPEAAVCLMAERLEPGGRLVASVWGRRERCGWAEVFEIIDARVHSEVCPLFFRMGSGSALADALAEAGLRRIVERRFAALLRYASEDDACDAALLGGPVALAYARFAEPVRREVRSAYAASIARFRRGQGYEIPAEFVVARGDKPGG